MTQPSKPQPTSPDADTLDSEPSRINRRRTLGAITASAAAATAVAVGVLARPGASAQSDETPTPTATTDANSGIVPIQSTTVGEMPTTGAIRGAPIGTQPQQLVATTATLPVAIQVPKAQIDAQIEVLDIVNGAMQNPTGPWVVSWYEQTSELGVVGNVVVAGHVDYWNVGPSVFYNIRNLVKGDEITLTGASNTTYTYVVDTNRIYGVQELTSGALADLVSATTTSVLTLFTCGGEFDYVNGEYLSRTVVRANLKA
ncbi:MAG TPA: class F sortase [Thermomicrobiales bacterium]|nr:class F sortase [Thermomicrobiales bacterium]